MRILSIDVGAKIWGWCYLDPVGIDGGSHKTESFQTFYRKVSELVELWKPDIIVVGKPNRFYNVIAQHNRYIGIACLVAEKHDITLIEQNDSHARAVVFRGLKIGSKEKAVVGKEIEKMTGSIDPDMNDAFVLAKATQMETSE